MKNRASSHLLIILLILILEIVGYWGIHRAALLRGYEPSIIGAAPDLFMFLPLFVVVGLLSPFISYRGNWILFTVPVLLFSSRMLVRDRLSRDPRSNGVT